MCEPSARPICLYGVFHVCHGPICPDRRHVRVPTLVPKCLSWYYKRAGSTLALSHPLTTNRCSSTPPQTCVQIVTLSLPSPDTCVSACLRSNSPEQPDQPCLHAGACSVCACVCVCVRMRPLRPLPCVCSPSLEGLAVVRSSSTCTPPAHTHTHTTAHRTLLTHAMVHSAQWQAQA